MRVNAFDRTEQEIVQSLHESLQQIPMVQARRPQWETRGGPRRADARIHVAVAGQEVVLLIEAKKAVYPRDVREVLWQLKRLVEEGRVAHKSEMLLPFLAAESISPGAKQVLKEENVGYYDVGGSLFLPAPGAYLYIERPPPKTIERVVRSLFSGKRAQVLHALFHDRVRWWGVKDLALAAHVSAATVSETMRQLDRFEWVATRGQGPAKERQLIRPGPLLDEWSRQIRAARPPRIRRYYLQGKDSEGVAVALAEACTKHEVEYVITQEAAAQRYSPFLSKVARVACRLAPEGMIDGVLSDLDARPVSEGANLLLLETKAQGEFLFKERLHDLWLASPLQVYLDLLHAGGRSEEMAAHLRSERIGA